MSKRLLGDDETLLIIEAGASGGTDVALELTTAATTHTEQRERRMLGKELDDMRNGVGGITLHWMIGNLLKGLAPTESGQWPESEVG